MVKAKSQPASSGGWSGRGLSPRSPRPPASPTAAIEANLSKLLEEASVEYVDTVWEELKKKVAGHKKPGADERGNTPSDLTDFDVWKDYQGSNPDDAKFLCYRPMFARPPLPLTLVSEDFAQFKQDAMQGTPEEVDYDFAEEFWSRLHDPSYVTDHEEVVDTMLSKLVSKYLGDYVDPCFSLQGRTKADGVLRRGTAVQLVFEFKAQAGNTGEPDFQVLDGFRRACILMSNLAAGVRQHALAVCVLGPRLEVWGATVESDKVWAEPLAESKCYGPEDHYLLATARIWRAIRLFVRDFKAMPLVSPPVPWPIASQSCVQRLNRGKLVFRYQNSKGDVEVAKFVSRYCLEAHKAWLPYAPEIYEFVESKGVTMIRMEYLSGLEPADELLEKVMDDKDHVSKLRSCLGMAVDAGHSRGFVHGDLRLFNILFRKSEEIETDGYPGYEVKILDFDWAGKLGEAAYPRMNKEIAWPPGARYGMAITKEHDIYFKDRLVEQLE